MVNQPYFKKWMKNKDHTEIFKKSENIFPYSRPGTDFDLVLKNLVLGEYCLCFGKSHGTSLLVYKLKWFMWRGRSQN